MKIDGIYFNPEQTKWLKEFIQRLKDEFAQETYWQKLCLRIDKLIVKWKLNYQQIQTQTTY